MIGRTIRNWAEMFMTAIADRVLLPEPEIICDRKDGVMGLKYGQTAQLIDSTLSGNLRCYLNISRIPHPGEITVSTYLYFQSSNPDFDGRMERVLHSQAVIGQDKMNTRPPMAVSSPVYAPHGGVVEVDVSAGSMVEFSYMCSIDDPRVTV